MVTKAARFLSANAVNRRTFVAGSAALAASAGLMRGVSRRASAQTALSGELKMWAYPLVGMEEDQKMWDGLIEGFNAENPDVKISVELQPWDRRVEKLVTAMSANAGPDVWYINIEDIPTHADHGRLASFDGVFTEEELADFYPGALGAMTWKGTVWALPILVAVFASFQNKKILEESGVTSLPVTWDEWLAAAPKCKEAGYYLTEFDSSDPQAFFYPLIWQAGGEPFVDGQPAFNSPEGVAALDFVLELFKGEYSPESVTAAEGISITERPIGLGEVALALPAYGNSDIQQLIDSWGEGVLEITAPPKNVNQVSTGGVGAYAVSAQSKNQDAAKAWVAYITNTENTTLINKLAGYLPSRISAGDIHSDDPLLSALNGTLSYMKAFPALPGGRQILTDALAPEIQSAILGEKTSQEALDAAAERATAIIAEQSAG